MSDPEPKLTDFNCSTCRAPVGVPCRTENPDKQRLGHARRADRLMRARADWMVRESDRAAGA